MDNLDTASLRRFDLKMKFDYLNEKQAWKMFTQLARSQGYKAAKYRAYISELKSMRQLAPGDFALLARQYRFTKSYDVAQIINDLNNEMLLKGEQSSGSIGFLRT